MDYFIIDFYCPKLKLIIEIDGDIHEQQKTKDLERDNIFNFKYGITTLRFTNTEVKNDKNKIKETINNHIKNLENKN